LRFAVTLLARPKKHGVGDISCFASPSCDEQVIVGRKAVLIGLFDNLHRRFLIQVTLPPTLKPENCKLVHTPGALTNKISSGEEVATPLASFQIGSIITGFPSALKRVKHPPQHRPQLQPCSPTSPHVN